MAYCALSDIQAYLGADAVVSLADDDNDGVADTATITAAIAAADAEIDSYIAAQYATPLSPVPVVVKKFSAVLAINHLYLRRAESTMPDKWTHEVGAMRKLLEMVGNGRMQLGVGGRAGESGDGAEVARGAEEATITREVLGGF